jgi:hypothetical protein
LATPTPRQLDQFISAWSLTASGYVYAMAVGVIGVVTVLTGVLR